MTRYRAVCECGDTSSAVPSRIVAESWRDNHRELCEFLSGREREIDIEETTPMSDAYPRECPVCGTEKPTASSFDLHMERNHTDEEAKYAVMGAIVDELAASESPAGHDDGRRDCNQPTETNEDNQ